MATAGTAEEAHSFSSCEELSQTQQVAVHEYLYMISHTGFRITGFYWRGDFVLIFPGWDVYEIPGRRLQPFLLWFPTQPQKKKKAPVASRKICSLSLCLLPCFHIFKSCAAPPVKSVTACDRLMHHVLLQNVNCNRAHGSMAVKLDGDNVCGGPAMDYPLLICTQSEQ